MYARDPKVRRWRREELRKRGIFGIFQGIEALALYSSTLAEEENGTAGSLEYSC